ncbi:MAG: preprotein translocase subunit SecG [Planctomycetota bacterium]
MAVFSFLGVGFIMSVAAVLFVICAVALILVILIQKGRGGGLTAALGGAGAGGLLGTKTGDFLTWVTIVLVSVFLLLAVVMAKYYRPTTSDFDAGPAARGPVEQPAPARRLPAEGPGAAVPQKGLPTELPGDLSGDTEGVTDTNFGGGS